MPIPGDIIKKVQQDFPEDEGILVLQRLKELQDEDSKLFHDRILRCLVALAKGRIDEFVKANEIARRDYRDLIMAAEGNWGNRARLFNLPFGVCPDEGRFKQWLNGNAVNLTLPGGSNAKWLIEAPDIAELFLKQLLQPEKANPKASDPNLYFAVLHIRCVRGERGTAPYLAMEAPVFVCYRVLPEENEFEFVKFFDNLDAIKKRER